MSQQHFLIAVEGNHDQSFIGRVLQKALNFHKFEGTYQQLEEVIELGFWRKFMPRRPLGGSERVYIRLNTPSFFYSKDRRICIGFLQQGSKNLHRYICRWG